MSACLLMDRTLGTAMPKARANAILPKVHNSFRTNGILSLQVSDENWLVSGRQRKRGVDVSNLCE